jgi:hypothetical protein
MKREGKRDMHLPSNKQQKLANIGVIKAYLDVDFPAFANTWSIFQGTLCNVCQGTLTFTTLAFASTHP